MTELRRVSAYFDAQDPLKRSGVPVRVHIPLYDDPTPPFGPRIRTLRPRKPLTRDPHGLSLHGSEDLRKLGVKIV